MNDKMELSTESIVKDRVSLFIQEAFRYGRLIGSSGLLFAIVVLFFLGIIYYQDFIDWIPEYVPIGILIAILLSIYVSKTNHRTFLKEADILFLTPVEKKMDNYFNVTRMYNFIIQAGVVTMILLLLSPLFVQKVSNETVQVWFYFIAPILLKGWNLHSNWQMMRSQERIVIHLHYACRLLFTFLFLYWIFSEGSLFVIEGYAVGGLFFILLYLSFFIFDKKMSRANTYAWYSLLNMELRLQRRFYQFVNAFVDVPQLQHQIKPRRWANFLIKGVPFQKYAANHYLLLRTFLRAGEYFGIFIRLSLIGGLLVYMLPNLYAQAILFFTFQYLIVIQIKGLGKHHQRIIWSSIFPVTEEEKAKAFSSVCFLILLIQAAIISLFFFFRVESWIHFFTIVGMAVLLCFLFSYKYIHRTKKAALK